MLCSFTAEGTGYRHWCSTVLSALADAGILPNDMTERFGEWERKTHGKYGEVPLAEREGYLLLVNDTIAMLAWGTDTKILRQY